MGLPVRTAREAASSSPSSSLSRSFGSVPAVGLVANVVLAYFLPPGTNFDLILRVMIMITMFASAYIAEVIRGGLALALATGVQAAPVIDTLDDLLEPYGGLGAYDRTDQVSDAFLDAELKQLRLIDRVPRLAVINAEGADTLFQLYENRGLRFAGGLIDEEIIRQYESELDEQGRKASTIASAIEIGRPVNLAKALRALCLADFGEFLMSEKSRTREAADYFRRVDEEF